MKAEKRNYSSVLSCLVLSCLVSSRLVSAVTVGLLAMEHRHAPPREHKQWL